PTTTKTKGIAIEYFEIFSSEGYAQTIPESGHRSEVTDKNEGVVRVLTTTHKGYNAIIGIVYIDPREAFWITIHNVKTWLTLVDFVQIAQIVAELSMMRIAWRFQ